MDAVNVNDVRVTFPCIMIVVSFGRVLERKEHRGEFLQSSPSVPVMLTSGIVQNKPKPNAKT